MKKPLYAFRCWLPPLALPATLRAQNELSNFSATGRGGVINTFATDYQVIGMNPANLGRQGDGKVPLPLAKLARAWPRSR